LPEGGGAGRDDSGVEGGGPGRRSNPVQMTRDPHRLELATLALTAYGGPDL